MIRRIGRVLAMGGAMVGAGLAAAPAARAQAKFELTPFFASYYALTTMSNDANGDGTNVKIQQLSAPTYGGRVTYWVSRTMGVEASAGYTGSGLRAFSTDTSSGGISFSVTATSSWRVDDCCTGPPAPTCI